MFRVVLRRGLDLGPKKRSCWQRRRQYSQWNVDSETGVISSKVKGTPRFQTVIGLEIHAQLSISTKLLSGCPVPTQTSSLYQKPNSQVWPMDVGVPGFLPRISQEAVHAAVLSAVATKCHIPQVSRFERKHYFYADLPLGYQVTQQRWPLARDGVLVCHRQPKKKGGKKKKEDSFSTRIERIQLEQDTGKTIMMTKDGVTKSLVDFNRAGCALIEIVFYPDLRSSSDAATVVATLRNLLRHIGTCDGKMEEGSLRCDLNVSVTKLSSNDEGDGDEDSWDTILQGTGKRVEVKNLNSFRQVKVAAEYEAIRQVEAIDNGKPTEQETRTFDVKSGQTVVIRSKGGAKDYRFMPEPDLPPVVLDDDAFNGKSLETFLADNLPELPEDARNRLQSQYNISEYLASVVTGDPPAIEIFDDAVQEARSQLSDESNKVIPQSVANLLCNELFALARDESNKSVDELLSGEESLKHSNVNGKQLGEVVALLVEGTISNTMAKQLLKILYSEEQGGSPREVAKQRGFELIIDTEELAKFCHQVLKENPDELEKYQLGGKFSRKMIKFFLGKAMSASRGNAHPERLNETLEQVLDEVAPDTET